MLDGFLLGHSVGRGELLVADIGGVALEGIKLGHISLDEELQCPPVDELVRIGDDGGEELLVLLIAAKLSLAVLGSCDDHRVQIQRVLHDVHLRTEPQLPFAILHALRYDDLELDIHASVSLGHVTEPCGHNRCVKHVVSHHLSILILDRLHDDELTVSVLDDEGIPLGLHLRAYVRDVILLLRQRQ